MLETIEIKSKSTSTACVIWMHGLGADYNDFVDIIPQLHLPEELGVKFVFPNAPIIPVTMAHGTKIRAWFDVDAIGSPNIDFDEAGIRKSQTLIDELVTKEIAQGIQSNRIILAGFSQGGVMALHCGLRYPKPLAGILALSCWLPLAKTLQHEISASNQSCPILMLHGTKDQIVPISGAEASFALLKNHNFNIEWRTYPMQHSVCPEEIFDIAKWLKARFE